MVDYRGVEDVKEALPMNFMAVGRVGERVYAIRDDHQIFQAFKQGTKFIFMPHRPETE